MRISKIDRFIEVVAEHSDTYAPMWRDLDINFRVDIPHKDLLKKIFKDKYEQIKARIREKAILRLRNLGERIEKLAKTTASLIVSQDDVYELEFIDVSECEIEYILPHERKLKKLLKGLYGYFISSLNWELSQDADLFLGPDDDYDSYYWEV